MQTQHSLLRSRYLSAVNLTSVFLWSSHTTQMTSGIKHTMPLYDSTAIKAFHSYMSPFSLNIHKCTYLRPSHLRLTVFLYTKASFDTGSSPYLTSKSAGLLKDIWKNVLKQIILSMIQCIFGQNSPETINNVSFYN